MKDSDLFQLALGLVPPWLVTGSSFNVQEKRLDININFPAGSTFPCAICGKPDCKVTCADIATHLGDRTQLAVFRKLCRLVGPAPSAVAKRSRAAIKPLRAPETPTAKMLCFPTPALPPLPIPATIDAMVRWLRSRDYIVLRKSEGWQIDQHHLSDSSAVVEFVNVRRARLRMPPFVLQEPEPMPIAAIVFHTERSRRWAHGGRNR